MKLVFHCILFSDEEIALIQSQLDAIKGANDLTRKANDQRNDEIKSLAKSLLNKLNESKVQETENRVEEDKSIDQLASSLQNTSETRSKSLIELQSKFESYVIEMGCEEKAGLKIAETIDELNTEKTQKIMNSLNDLNSKNTSIPNELKAVINDHTEAMIQHFSEANSLVDDSIKNCDKLLTEKQTILMSADDCLIEKIGEHKEVIDDIASNVKQISDCVSEKTSEMIRMALTMEKSQNREIENRYKSFESFVKNDLIKDVPTGTTPQKTTYTFPRDLVQTSPHERILERFRLAKAAETPLPEECESEILSDSSSSLKSSHSFDSLPSNDENVKPLTDAQKRKRVGLQKRVKPKDTSFIGHSGQRSVTPKPLATNLKN